MYINPQVFRMYDIRGVVEKDFSEEFVQKLGEAFGTYMERYGAKTVAIGRDCRLSSPYLYENFVLGLKRTGRHIINCGQIPTPLLYFAVHYLKSDAGVQITGSHNPPEYNGFKMQIGENSIFGEEIQEIRKMMETEDTIRNREKESKVESVDMVTPYCDFLLQNIKINRKNLKLVIDGGNGVAGSVFARTVRLMGLNPIELYCEPDGHFPNHHPDPTIVENLKDLICKVKEIKGDIGVAFDGDGDRIGVIDDQGEIVWGDKLLIVFAREILKENPGATVIGEVKCSKVLFDEIKKAGGKPLMWKTGHSLIKAKIKETKALLAGEMSGHLFFAHRYFGYDDAIYSAMRLIEILSNTDKKLSELLLDIPKTYITPEIRIDCADEIKFKVVERVVQYFKQKYEVIDVDGARIIYPDGWGLIRASNTQPVLVLRFEADSPQRLDEIKREVESIIINIQNEISS